MAGKRLPSESPRRALAQTIASYRGAFAGIGLLSGVVNLLALTGAFFMLQVYDRVVPSRSVPTLVGLCILAGALFVFQGVLDLIRSRLLLRISLAVDERISGKVFLALVRLPLRTSLSGDGLQLLRDLDLLRAFLSSAGPVALFDLPWVPLYLGICFIFHFWIGVTAAMGALLLFGLTLLAEQLTKKPTGEAGRHAASRSALAEAARRNAEALQAMGFAHRIAHRWDSINAGYLLAQARASDVTGGLSALSKTLRMMLQSGVLAIGAFLVIHQEATGGIMIAASIVMSRALAPIELAISHWKGFAAARQGYSRLNELLALLPETAAGIALPPPRQSLSVEAASIAPPGIRTPVVHDASFSLSSGAGLAIIGPSASGKSTLARAIAGVWLPAKGVVRLDGATLDQWCNNDLGRHIGYLPQDVQLFDGTVAENIARFESDARSETILKAAHVAGVHDLIVHLSEGYDTLVGEGGFVLSAGQRQRIALARALFGDPFLVVLDEPNSNLDAEGEAALTKAIQSIRDRGGIAVVVAHRPNALQALEQVLILARGRIQAFGPKNEVLNKATVGARALRPVSSLAQGEAAAS
jgi:ATP-binding cassette subfamily C protein